MIVHQLASVKLFRKRVWQTQSSVSIRFGSKVNFTAYSFPPHEWERKFSLIMNTNEVSSRSVVVVVVFCVSSWPPHKSRVPIYTHDTLNILHVSVRWASLYFSMGPTPKTRSMSQSAEFWTVYAYTICDLCIAFNRLMCKMLGQRSRSIRDLNRQPEQFSMPIAMLWGDRQTIILYFEPHQPFVLICYTICQSMCWSSFTQTQMLINVCHSFAISIGIPS